MHIGIMIPSREAAMTSNHDAFGLVRFAQAAEQAGFDSVWTGDSLLRVRVRACSLTASFRQYGRRWPDERE